MFVLYETSMKASNLEKEMMKGDLSLI